MDETNPCPTLIQPRLKSTHQVSRKSGQSGKTESIDISDVVNAECRL